MDEMVRIGAVAKPKDKVLSYAAKYLSGTGGWAYPAYDTYRGTASGPVDDADLLAVSLLNAGQNPIESYYSLQGLLQPMNQRLANPALDVDFIDATDETFQAIADLFGILDDFEAPYVKKTKLLKVLHRKKPHSIPLFDENIRRCYSVLGDPPVPADPNRTNRDFAPAWLPAFQRDLISQLEFFQDVAGMALESAPISLLRSIDIVGWRIEKI